MAKIQFFKTTANPTTPVADAIYFVEGSGGSDAELFVTDAAGVLHDVGNTTKITNIAQALINSTLSAQNSVEVYADITARDAATLTKNTLAVVTDASGDPTVNSGAALYIYEAGPDTWSKLSEFESLDVVLDWNNLQNGPTSTAAAIDAAVTASHTHSNKAELDRLGLTGDGCVTVDGAAAYGPWAASQW